jgi:hypothetical protein
VTIRSGTKLAQLVQRSAAAAADDRCELCSARLEDTHRHILDLAADELRCACRGCALLFEREAAARGHYRLVPQRRVRLDPPAVDSGVPVGLAFYVVQPDGRVLVRYPGPAGATTGVVEPTEWSAWRQHCPQLDDLAPAVEALLVNSARGRSEHWIVPLDDCYRLVAIIREHWTGFSGGRNVWPALDRFFATLAEPRHGRVTVGTG